MREIDHQSSVKVDLEEVNLWLNIKELEIDVVKKAKLGTKAKHGTVMILSFWTDRSGGQTVQTQIRLLLEEQSDQGLHCSQFPVHLSDALL